MMLKICQLRSQTFVNQQQYSSRLCYSYCINRYPPQGRSLEIPRGKGVIKAKILEAKYEAQLKSLEGGGGQNRKTFCGGSKDTFCYYTLYM